MINLNVSTIICRPVQQVFDFVSTAENDFQWQYGTLATAKLSKGGTSLGTLFRSIGHLMGRRILTTFEVTEYEPNTIYSFKSVSGPLFSQTSYTFEPTNRGTKINISTHTKAVDSLELNEAVLEKKMRKQLTENLALLKDLLEANHMLPASAAKSLTHSNMD